MELGLSYDDVLLIPARSSIQSRKDIATETSLTKEIKLKIPILSANMDTVTESTMAITMAQLGGIGIIHRFNTIEDQVKEVQKVKRYRNAIIENPVTITPEYTLAQARNVMQKKGITGLLVVDSNNKLVGILTSRDIRFKPPESTKISELMTKKINLIVGHKDIDFKKAQQVMFKHRIEKLPLINNDWTLSGLITGKDIHRKTKHPNSSIDEKDRLIVGAAIGVKSDSLSRAKALIEVGVDILVIDIAHGHSDLAVNIIKAVRKEHATVPIMAGNVATAKGTRELIKEGADCIKVGVGPGSICTTRIVTGCGYPHLSAVVNCAKEADKYKIPIIADGGIRMSGDITKAIAGGASAVMLGSLLAGTDESPGKPIIKNGKKFKVVRGMASYGAKLGRDARENKDDDIFDFVPEGVEATVPYKGGVSEVMNQLLGGFRSGMSYCGAINISQIRGKGEFIRITGSGLKESHSHDVNLV